MRSMTAYGRAAVATRIGLVTVEIQSVNRKFLEINAALPKELLRYEIDVKKWVGQQVSRGQVNIKLAIDYEEYCPLTVKANLPLARQIKAAWDQIADDLGFCKAESVRLDLFKEEELLTVEPDIKDEKAYQEAIKETLDCALKAFLKMKLDEGLVLQRDILERLSRLKEWIDDIAACGTKATEKYREKLKARLTEVLSDTIDSEPRILQEIAIFAEKIDIAEELTRFLCHLKHFEEIALSNKGGVGKTLEFILQELGREINTIGSKSSDITIARRVVDIKSGLEQIKEQIQNIE